MNKRLQGFIAGTLLGTTLASGLAFASGLSTLYDVRTDGIKIVVDGKKLNPKDGNGNTVEPFIYNGTTYLPVRAVADALGKAVYWDGPNYTVYLGEMNGTLEYPTVQIEDMTSIADKPWEANILVDNYGNTYDRGIRHDEYYSHEFEYLLNMKYSRFRGTLYVAEGTSRDGTASLSITADGKTIYTSPQMDKTSSPVNVDVNVTGYNDIKIEFSNSDYNAVVLCLADAGFYQ